MRLANALLTKKLEGKSSMPNETKKIVALVACCKTKLSGSHPAKDLYQSLLFKKSREYAEKNADYWLILSAKHGVLHPDEVIESYDVTLKEMSKKERVVWGNSIKSVLEPIKSKVKLLVLCGEIYCEWLDNSFNYDLPLEGLQIGRRLNALDKLNQMNQNEA